MPIQGPSATFPFQATWTPVSPSAPFYQDGKAHIQAGAGIVADSVPELEWKETRNKASALLVAIQLAEMIVSGEEKKSMLKKALKKVMDNKF